MESQEQVDLAAPSNNRHSNHLLVRHEGRKPLFAGSATLPEDGGPKETKTEVGQSSNTRSASTGSHNAGQARRTNSESHILNRSTSSLASPGSTRIPRPSATTVSGHRRPLSLAEAFRLAENEEHKLQREPDDDDQDQLPDASPSPAPRPWRARRDLDQNSVRKQLGRDHLDTKGAKDKENDKPGKDGEALVGSDWKNKTLGKVNDRKPLDAATGKPNAITDEGVSWRNRLDWRSKAPEGNGVGNGNPSAKTLPIDGSDIPALVPGIDDIPLPSVELPDSSQRGQKAGTTDNPSPEKSFAWQVDEDFTAGDLQVSDSPRIRTTNRPFANRLAFDDSSEVDIDSRTRVNNPGSRNTKLDEIRSREVKSGTHIPIEQPPSRPRNNKLDEIRNREIEAEAQIPIPERHLTTFRNTKLDDIRQREAEGLSRRQVAAARLEEIKEKNFMSRSLSPDEPRPQLSRGARTQSNEVVAPITGSKVNAESPARSSYGAGGVRIPDTPVTVYKSRRETNGGSVIARNETHRQGQNTEAETKRPGISDRRDSRDLLRRLARAASASPGPEPAPEAKKEVSARKGEKGLTDYSSTTANPRGARRALTTNNVGSRKQSNTRDAKDMEKKSGKPTVGFAGLRRIRSTESTRSKRSSVHSEADPTDRIEAEMKLFAPPDNHSERGSVRAPSPLSSSEDKDADDGGGQDATPRPKKEDPLLMPTPRVTGAYVETPVTIKAAPKIENIEAPKLSLETPLLDRNEPSLRIKDRDTASDPGASERDEAVVKPSVVTRRRSHSLPRPRQPLRNSAKLPSVKDDLKELQRLYNIEDSTLDDMEEMLTDRKDPSPYSETLLKEGDNRPGDESDDSFDQKVEQSYAELQNRDKEATTNKEVSKKQQKVDELGKSDLAAYDRMSKSLTTSLLGIRSAKKGMERLEGNLSGQEHKVSPDEGTLEIKHSDSYDHDRQAKCPSCVAHPSQISVTYVHLPVPRLYSSDPHFRLTTLGLITLLLSVWYALETGMCALYCSPTTCSSTPCVWSYDDPSFGVALPIKVDQWATGGAGRIVFNCVAEEVQDWFADALDAAYGRDILDANVEHLSFDEKRSYRRRLRKRGLDSGTGHLDDAPPEVRARWDAWRQTRMAKEKAKEARSMGYTTQSEDDETIGGDQRVW